METGEIAQAAIAMLEGSGSVEDIIGNPFSSEGFLSTILENPIRLRSAIIIFFIWVCALIWAIKDANSRSRSFRFVLLAAVLVILFTPIFGILLYIAIRPQGRKWDKTPWRDTAFQQIQVCENCGNFNNINHSYCTNCGESLLNTCHECKKKYSKNYAYCPYCGAPCIEE